MLKRGMTKQQGDDRKTRYDWVPGREGELLAPDGSKSVQQQVAMRNHPHDVLRILFNSNRLYGQALEDARVSKCK